MNIMFIIFSLLDIYKGIVSSIPYAVLAFVDYPISFKCLGHGNPPPKLTWTRADKRDVPFTSTPDGKFYVSNVQHIHSGIYQCTAVTISSDGQEYSRMSRNTTLYVISKYFKMKHLIYFYLNKIFNPLSGVCSNFHTRPMEHMHTTITNNYTLTNCRLHFLSTIIDCKCDALIFVG